MQQAIIDLSIAPEQEQTPLDSLVNLFANCQPTRRGEQIFLSLNGVSRQARLGKLPTDLVYLAIAKRFKEETGQELTQKLYKAGLQELLLSLESEEPEEEAPQERATRKREMPEQTRYLLGSLQGDSQELARRKLLERQFLWTPKGLYRMFGERVTELWLADFRFHAITDLFEPSEEVNGVLQMVDRTYHLDVSTSRENCESLTISRADAAGERVTWPDRLSKVAIPNPEKKNLKRIAQFFDEVATTLNLPATKHYTSTGLLCEKGVYKFATFAGGTLTAGGRETNGTVSLPPEYQSQQRHMERYQFFVDSKADKIADLRVLLRCQRLTPKQPGICRVLTALQALAPVSQLFTPTSALIYGRSQSKKSTLARVFLQWCTDIHGHQDEWATYNLRAGSTTAYFLEQLSYYLAGLLQLCDDALQVEASPKEQEAFFTRWSKLISYSLTKQGSGRGRSNRGNGGTAKNWYPRGPLVGTIEVLPAPHKHASTLGRCILLPLDGKDALDKILLTELQEQGNAQAMNRAYTGYVQWLLTDIERASVILTELAPFWDQLGLADRLGGLYARVETGLVLLYRYAVEMKAISSEEAEHELVQAHQELLTLARAQADALHIEAGAAQALDPVEQFKRAFAEALHKQRICCIDTKRCLIKRLDGSEVEIPQPPQDLPSDFDLLKVGWKLLAASREYDRNTAFIAGPLYQHTTGQKRFNWSLRIRSTEWERIYQEIETISEKGLGLILPGSTEMLSLLEKAGLLAKNRPFQTDGKSKKYHVFDCSWYIDEQEEQPPEDRESMDNISSDGSTGDSNTAHASETTTLDSANSANTLVSAVRASETARTDFFESANSQNGSTGGSNGAVRAVRAVHASESHSSRDDSENRDSTFFIQEETVKNDPGPAPVCLKCTMRQREAGTLDKFDHARKTWNGQGWVCASCDRPPEPEPSKEPPPERAKWAGGVKRQYRDIPTAYVDAQSGLLLYGDETRQAGSNPRLSELLTILPDGCERILLVGRRPGNGTADGLYTWLREPQRDWRVEKLFIDSDLPVLKLVQGKRELSVRRAASWFGEGNYTVYQVRDAFNTLDRLLQELFDKGARHLTTPGSTGLELWNRGRQCDYPILDQVLLQQLEGSIPQEPRSIRDLIRSESGQGRIELCPMSGRETLPGFAYLDGRFMYAALCKGLGFGPAEHDNRPDFDPYRRGRYRVAFTVPSDWTHVGIFSVKRENGEGWWYPGAESAGQSFETWVDATELRLAKQPPAGLPGWKVEIRERLLLQSASAGHPWPLDVWSSKLIELRAKIANERDIPETIRPLLLAAVRNILLHGVGSFARSMRDELVIVYPGEPLPPAEYAPEKHPDGTWTYLKPASLSDWSRKLMHPEFAAAIWARCRTHLLYAAKKQGRGQIVSETGALLMPRDWLVAFRTDAIYATSNPGWPDDGVTPGQFRLKGLLTESCLQPGIAGAHAQPNDQYLLLNRLRDRSEAAWKRLTNGK